MNKDIQILISEHNGLIGSLIHKLDKKALTVYNTALKEFNITSQQAMIILFIYVSKEEIYQKDIEERMGLTNPSVTTLIWNMMGKDFVYRIQSIRDARCFHLHLTPKSLSMADEIASEIIKTNKILLAPLSKEEVVTLQRLLCGLL